MDCDDVAFALAAEGSVLSDEALRHLAECEVCSELRAGADDAGYRWIVRVPEDALDDRDLLVLPTVDPIVFVGGRELARGGMGRITRVRDRRLGREVALKEVLDPDMRARFEREVAITAQLQHPAIVPIYEAGEWPDGSAFYTMRLVSGGTLADAIAKAPGLEDRLALLPHVVATTEALAYAHSKGIVHRDLKPGNVLVGEFRETVVIDWGLAKELHGADDRAPDRPSISPHLTMVGSVIGTPGFMAPEQAAGDEVDERADVYSLGSILYNVLAGQPPYWGGGNERTPTTVVAEARVGPPTALAKLVPGVPADLRAIVERAMARDKAARFANAKDMAEELRRFEAGQLLRSRDYGVIELVAHWVRRHRAIAVAAAIVVVIGMVAVVGIARSRSAERDARRQAEHALAESRLEQGRQLLIGGSPDEAAPLIAAALAQLPDDPIAHRLDAQARRDAHRRLVQVTGGAAAFSPDGRALAVGRDDGSILVLDAATGVTSRTLPRSGGAIGGVAYSADGTRLLVAATTGAQLRDVATGAVVATLSSIAIHDASFAGADRIVLATKNGLSLVGIDGAQIASIAVDTPRELDVSRDGATVLVRTATKIVVASTRELSQIAEIPISDSTYDAKIAADGTVVTAAWEGGKQWSLAPVREVAQLPIAVALAWLDDTTLLADASVVDLRTGAVRAMAYDSLVQCNVAIDAGHAITGGYDHRIRIWDISRGALPVVSIDAAGATSRLAVDPTKRRAVSVGTGERAPVELWDVTALPAPTTMATVAGDIQQIVADRAGRLAVRWHASGTEQTVLLGASHEVIGTLPGWPLAFRPNADEIVSDVDGHFVVASARDGRVLRTIAGAQPMYQLAFARDGMHVATSSTTHVDVRDATTWEIVSGFDVTPDATALAFDGGGHIATGHQDGTVRLWDAHTGVLSRTMIGHTAQVNSLELRGATLVSGSWDSTTRRWALPSGESLGIVNASHQRINQISVSPNDELIAITDGSAVLSVVDAAQGTVIQRIPTDGGLETVLFVDDDHVMVGTYGGRIELVDLR